MKRGTRPAPDRPPAPAAIRAFRRRVSSSPTHRWTFFDEILHTFETRLAAESGDTSLLARSDDPSGLSRSADTAEQLAALQRGDMNPANLESIVSPTPSGMDDAYGSSDLSRAGTPAPGRDRTPLDPARFEGYESVPSMEIPEPLEIPPDRGFVENSSVVWDEIHRVPEGECVVSPHRVHPCRQ